MSSFESSRSKAYSAHIRWRMVYQKWTILFKVEHFLWSNDCSSSLWRFWCNDLQLLHQINVTQHSGYKSTFKAYVDKGGRGAAVNLTWTWTQKRQLQQALLDQQSSVEFTHVITITCWVMSQHLWLWGGPEDTEIIIIKLLWLWTVALDNVYIDFLRCGLVDMLFELKNPMDD